MAMSKSTDTMSERDDIEMLLPWYVTGKLDAADRTRVEAYLKSTPDLARQVDLIRAEQDQARRVNEALRAPASLTVERLLAVGARTAKGRCDVTRCNDGPRLLYDAIGWHASDWRRRLRVS